MPNKTTEQSNMALTYNQTLGDYSTRINLNLNGPDTEVLDNCLAQFTTFLQMMGFTYVTSLTAMTD